MKTVRRPNYFTLLLLALGLTLGPALRAQDKPSAPAAPAVASAEPEKPAAPAAEQEKPDDEKKTAGSGDSKAETVAAAAEASDEQPAKDQEPPRSNRRHGGRHSSNNERVAFGSNSTLAAGEKAENVVSIIGSSTSAGEVSDSVVSILGGSRVTEGSVGNTVVSILGNTYINGHVKGEVVTILGNAEFGPDAVVEGEVVCIGGEYKRDAKAVIKGDIHNIAIAGHHFNFEPLSVWFTQCVLYARPLAFNNHMMWAWGVALAFLVFYTLIALIVPGGVLKCVETLEQRPGSSLLAALLTLLLTPVAYILLLLTLAIAVGIVLIPTFSLGLFFAALFGKVVMLTWVGRGITRLLAGRPVAHPALGVLIGAILVLLLYTIPVVGFITYKLLGILGLGVVVYTLILQFKASRPPKPVMAAVVPPAALGAVSATPEATGALPPLVASAAPAVISAATLPRAGFWIRVGASLLDCVIIMMVSVVTRIGPGFLLLFAVYCTIMWASKGTTIGGIICGLKVVRLDDRPVDWGIATVRALGGFLSFFLAGLGFMWVAFDDEKQSWHDKIAGTTIVKVPKGTALL